MDKDVYCLGRLKETLVKDTRFQTIGFSMRTNPALSWDEAVKQLLAYETTVLPAAPEKQKNTTTDHSPQEMIKRLKEENKNLKTLKTTEKFHAINVEKLATNLLSADPRSTREIILVVTNTVRTMEIARILRRNVMVRKGSMMIQITTIARNAILMMSLKTSSPSACSELVPTQQLLLVLVTSLLKILEPRPI